jgi:hypothetical protein
LSHLSSVADIAEGSSSLPILCCVILEPGGQGGRGFVFLVNRFAGSEGEGGILVPTDANSLRLQWIFGQYESCRVCGAKEQTEQGEQKARQAL